MRIMVTMKIMKTMIIIKRKNYDINRDNNDNNDNNDTVCRCCMRWSW